MNKLGECHVCSCNIKLINLYCVKCLMCRSVIIKDPFWSSEQYA